MFSKTISGETPRGKKRMVGAVLPDSAKHSQFQSRLQFFSFFNNIFGFSNFILFVALFGEVFSLALLPYLVKCSHWLAWGDYPLELPRI